MTFDVYTRFVLALVAVVVLMLVFAWVLRRYGLGARLGARNGRRLAVIEVAAVDAKRRLVLVRRDDTEHLILLGIESDLLIESGIKSSSQAPESFAATLKETQP